MGAAETTSNPGPIEAAWQTGDRMEVLEAVGARLARAMDECESFKELKALSVGLVDINDRVNADAKRDDDQREGIDLVKFEHASRRAARRVG